MIAEATPFLVFECSVDRPTTLGDSGEGRAPRAFILNRDTPG